MSVPDGYCLVLVSGHRIVGCGVGGGVGCGVGGDVGGGVVGFSKGFHHDGAFDPPPVSS